MSIIDRNQQRRKGTSTSTVQVTTWASTSGGMWLGSAYILQIACSHHPYSLLHCTRDIYAQDKEISVQQQHAAQKGLLGLCSEGGAVQRHTSGGKNAHNWHPYIGIPNRQCISQTKNSYSTNYILFSPFGTYMIMERDILFLKEN